MARQCPRQVHHLINALTVVRQVTWPGSVQVIWIAASHLSLLLERKTLFVMLAARLDTKLSLVQIDQFQEMNLIISPGGRMGRQSRE